MHRKSRRFAPVFFAFLLAVPLGWLGDAQSRAASQAGRYQLYTQLPALFTPLGKPYASWNDEQQARAGWTSYVKNHADTSKAFLLDTQKAQFLVAPQKLVAADGKTADTFTVTPGQAFNQLILHSTRLGGPMTAAFLPVTSPSNSFVPQPGLTYVAFDRLVGSTLHPQSLFVPLDSTRSGGIYENPYARLDLRTPAPAGVTAVSIDQWLSKRPGLAGLGQSYIQAQKTYGTNVLYLLAASILETGWGSSTYAKDRNNLYGVSAFDSNPDMASAFPSKPFAIAWQSYWIRADWLTPSGTGSTHYGGEPNLFGIENRYGGHSVYATDAYYFWKLGELMQTALFNMGLNASTYLNTPSGSPISATATAPPSYPLPVSGQATTSVNVRQGPLAYTNTALLVPNATVVTTLAKGKTAQIRAMTLSPRTVDGHTFPTWYQLTTGNGATGWATGVYVSADQRQMLRVQPHDASGNRLYGSPVPLYSNASGTTVTTRLTQGAWGVRLGPQQNRRIRVNVGGQLGWIAANAIELFDPTAPPPQASLITQIQGADRYQTSIQLLTHPESGWQALPSSNVVLVNAIPDHEVDALAANSLAGALDAPVMVVNGNTSTLTSEQRQFLSDLKAKQALVVGMPLSDSLKAQLVAAGLTVHDSDFYGVNRYDTANKVASYIPRNTQAQPKAVFVARGDALPDALSVGSLAAGEADPVLLYGASESNTQWQESVQLAEQFAEQFHVPIYVLGGSGAIPESVVSELGATRIEGSNRYDTNLQLCNQFDNVMQNDTLYIANGQDTHLVDALSAGSVAGQRVNPILLVNGSSLTDEQKTFLQRNARQFQQVVFVGGSAAFSDSLISQVNALVST